MNLFIQHISPYKMCAPGIKASKDTCCSHNVLPVEKFIKGQTTKFLLERILSFQINRITLFSSTKTKLPEAT